MSKDDARNRILDAAGPVFAAKGYRAATVREICEKAGMNVASVNYYFGDKENLYVETIKRVRPPRIEEKLQGAWSTETSPADKLRDFIHAMVRALCGAEMFPWLPELLKREIANPTPACEGLLQEPFFANFDLLQSILVEILPPDTPPHKRHQIAFTVIGQCVHFRVSRKIAAMLIGSDEFEAHYGPDEVATHISRVCLAALGLAPPIVEPGRKRDQV